MTSPVTRRDFIRSAPAPLALGALPLARAVAPAVARAIEAYELARKRYDDQMRTVIEDTLAAPVGTRW